MSWIKSERIQFINDYERTYGKRLKENDEMLPIMHFIFDAGKSTDKRLAETKDLISKLDLRIGEVIENTNSRTYQFTDGEAWKWQMGITIKILVLVGSLALILWSTYFWWQSYHHLTKAEALLKASPVVESKILQNVKTDHDGYIFLEFRPPRGSTVNFFTEYLIKPDSTIRVYVGKK